jgi:hypothetical protein
MPTFVGLVGVLLFLVPAPAVVGCPIAGPLPPACGGINGHTFVECHVILDAFPQQTKSTNSSNCTGTLTGILTGLEGSPPYDANYSGEDFGEDPAYVADCVSCTFSMTVQHADTCVVGEPPLVSFWNGLMTIDGILIIHDGVVGSGSMVVPYDMLRGGTVAMFQYGKFSNSKTSIKNTTLTFGDADGAVDKSYDQQGGTAWAAVVIQLGIGNVCPNGGPVSVDIAINALDF